MSTLVDSVAVQLGEANRSLHSRGIKGFRVWRDQDLNAEVAEVADVLYGLSADDDWGAAALDAFCETARQALNGLVAYTYCDFRSEKEAGEAIRGCDEGWIALASEMTGV